MLNTEKVKFIQKYDKIWVIVAIFTVFVLRVIYCKIQRNQMIFSDDFEFAKSVEIKSTTTEFNDLEFEDIVTENIKNRRKQKEKHKIIKRNIKNMNEVAFIHNEMYMKRIVGRDIVIVVQVGTTDWALTNLLDSIAESGLLKRVLIVFSHPFYVYDEYINDIENKQVITEYIQIFYPFNLQLYPNIFPGNDRLFCTGDYYKCELNKNRRDAVLSQMKNFWWWQVNHIFEHMPDLEFYEGYVLFLNYDQILAEDIIYMIELMSSSIGKKCPHCDFISLGAYQPDSKRFQVYSGDMFIEAFGTTDYNFGIAFNRTVWRKIKAYKQHFCYFNDYRWDESLKYLSTKLPEGKIWMLASSGTRVISTGCDDSVQNGDCDQENSVADAVGFFRLISRGLYPRELLVKPTNRTALNITRKGFFEDARDQEFCMFLVEPGINKLLEVLDL